MPSAIRCKLEFNALTVPKSCKIRFLPNAYLGSDEIAAGMVDINPALTPDLAKSAISAFLKTVQKELINGAHINLDNNLIFTLSFSGRVNGPNDPLPPIAETLNVQVRATAEFHREIHHQGRLEKENMTQKLPLITQAENATLQLKDVVSSTDILQLSGEHLNFDPLSGNGECVISGTRSGRAVQTQFGAVSGTSIALIPTIPAQEETWNNEYSLSLSLRYTEHGTLRTGIYGRRLRSPLTVTIGDETGILTGSAAAPHVTVTSGTVSANTKLRIQVVQDLQEARLLFSLLDMREGGLVGAAVNVIENGDYRLDGFAGSAVSDLEITVSNYAGLWDMIRNDYGGSLVDVLDLRPGT
jgi:hypothetical protein